MGNIPHAAGVSIIMPTLALRERAASLLRAIDTVVSQQGVRAVPIVVVNGSAAATDLKEHLARRRDIRLITLEDGGLPPALRVGRAHVDTPSFAVLDDDDELLPGALATRLDALGEVGEYDAVVTSGFFEGFGRRDLSVAAFGGIEADPVRTLVRSQWLPPCAGLFSSDGVTPDFFSHLPAFLEWTYLGLRLALTRRIRFLGRPTFVYRTDTPGSLSKSKAYALAQPSGIRRLLEMDLPSDVRAILHTRLAGALHAASERELRDGNRLAAWRWHLRCLARPHGWRYLPYTRHLVRPARRLAPTAGELDRVP